LSTASHNGRHGQQQGQVDMSKRQAACAEGQIADWLVCKNALAANPVQKTGGSQRTGEAGHPRCHQKSRVARENGTTENRVSADYYGLFLF
jgi:hypothetical protein